MSDQALDAFLREGMQYVYPGEWKDEGEVALTVVHDGVGIYVSNIPGDTGVSFAAGMLTGLALSPELVAAVAHVNQSTRVGGVYLSNGTTDWQVIYTCKMLKGWIDTSSRASAQMVIDTLSNMPDLVNIRANYLQERFQPAERWPLANGWTILLLSHM